MVKTQCKHPILQCKSLTFISWTCKELLFDQLGGRVDTVMLTCIDAHLGAKMYDCIKVHVSVQVQAYKCCSISFTVSRAQQSSLIEAWP